ncbi:isopenicillin N synthase family oxygenase [Nostocaceae cyanobacterium CENA369]|uniref:Isopenicillin N synthase family oxygenase n=1 Tax=Dendronalium phyllosphericum CENA369 TaxID=1725256 RepID=A0A8J7IB10_9NOST|nr:2-oxoglutarate and iron-dependent oxygenase domain-containing protein [Dendronalium phyllosphericum]MBH8575532.1 isopenicillin N synthase family oxygenase [Dendronalium phyllosphericum CENA369]
MTSLQIVDKNFSQVPIIDVSVLVYQTGNSSGETRQNRLEVAAQIRQACQDYGFFYIVGHGVDEQLQQQLEHLSQQFFAQDIETKLQINMAVGGRAWRGYFPVGNELTSGKPDLKEGIYFGAELEENHPLVKAGVPMHGRNLFPSNMPQFRETVLEYIESMTKLGHILMASIALSLALEESYFADRYTKDPLILFRIFNYPPNPSLSEAKSEWGVGEHTDYGVLTILKQDNVSGLQVKSKSGWIDAPPIPGSFICNIGDMLDRMTQGLYRSTPHRVLNQSKSNRLSFPFFFDPNFNVEVKPIELNEVVVNDDKSDRWDKASVREFRGTYGDYLLNKVSKVFPELRQTVF